jgi:hypothetical protein
MELEIPVRGTATVMEFLMVKMQALLTKELKLLEYFKAFVRVKQ